MVKMLRMSPCLALYLIIDWRILYMAHASRHSPGASCEIIFDKQEWHAIYMVTKKKVPPQSNRPIKDTLLITETHLSIYAAAAHRFAGVDVYAPL